MNGHMDSFSAHSSSSSAAASRIAAAAAAAAAAPAAAAVRRLNTSTYSLQLLLYYNRQVPNPLTFHHWFLCMLRLSVTPLPKKLNCELTSHDPCGCLFLACVTCYVLRWCVVRGGPLSCASSPSDLWPLSNLSG